MDNLHQFYLFKRGWFSSWFSGECFYMSPLFTKKLPNLKLLGHSLKTNTQMFTQNQYSLNPRMTSAGESHEQVRPQQHLHRSHWNIFPHAWFDGSSTDCTVEMYINFNHKNVVMTVLFSTDLIFSFWSSISEKCVHHNGWVTMGNWLLKKTKTCHKENCSC